MKQLSSRKTCLDQPNRINYRKYDRRRGGENEGDEMWLLMNPIHGGSQDPKLKLPAEDSIVLPRLYSFNLVASLFRFIACVVTSKCLILPPPVHTRIMVMRSLKIFTNLNSFTVTTKHRLPAPEEPISVSQTLSDPLWHAVLSKDLNVLT